MYTDRTRHVVNLSGQLYYYYMDSIVEQGFDRLLEVIKETKEKQDDAAEKIMEKDTVLLEKMIAAVAQIIPNVGSEFLLKAKQDTKGDLYDQKYYPDKMIILGKTESPVSFRPDDPKKKVTTQFCVASEKGELFELMFSNDEIGRASCRERV